MESTDQTVEVYQLRIWIRRISPQIWRRLLVRSDSTIAELHDTLQIAFGWADEHLHQFLIRGKPYGVWRRKRARTEEKRPNLLIYHIFHHRSCVRSYKSKGTTFDDIQITTIFINSAYCTKTDLWLPISTSRIIRVSSE